MIAGYGRQMSEGVDGTANVVIQVTSSPACAVIAFSYLSIIAYILALALVARFMLLRSGQPTLKQLGRYSETREKTIEEVEGLFKNEAIMPRKTSKGNSGLVAEAQAVQNAQAAGKFDTSELLR